MDEGGRRSSGPAPRVLVPLASNGKPAGNPTVIGFACQQDFRRKALTVQDDIGPKAGGGPHLIVAAFCEQVLEEKDGVQSLIRVVDRYFVQVPAGPLPPDVKAGIVTNLAILVKSGDFKGPAQMAVSLTTPAGALAVKPVTAPVVFKGDEHGVSVVLRMAISVEEEGLYWANVRLDGRLLTRVPLRIVFGSTPAPGAEPADAAR